MNEKFMELLGQISESVKGITEKQIELEGKIEKTSAKQAPEENKELSEIKNELIKIKSFNVQTAARTEKGILDHRVEFYKKLFNAHFNKDAESIKELRDFNAEMRKTYEYDETAGTGSGNMGYFIPTEVSQNIVDLNVRFKAGNSIVPLLNPYPMNTNNLDVGEYIDGAEAGMIGAHSIITDSAGSAGRYQLAAKKIACLLYYDNELLQDVTPRLIQRIEGDAINAFDRRTNFCVLAADGSADFTNASVTGILNTSTVNTVTMATSAVGNISADDLASMIDAVTANIQQGYFVMSRTLRPVIRTLKDTYGQYIMGSPAGDGKLETIWGVPVIWINSGSSTIMPAYSAIGADTAFAIYGDFANGVIMGDRMSLELAIDTSVKFDYYMTAFRYVKRQDIKIVGKAFAVLKTHA